MNVGLLSIEGGSIQDGEFKSEVNVNMVVNVSADSEGGGLKKLVINPLA